LKCVNFPEDVCADAEIFIMMASVALLTYTANVIHITILAKTKGLLSTSHGISVLWFVKE